MFINCRHCNALVATDPATDLPPERCPRCAGMLREPAGTASKPAQVETAPPAAETPSISSLLTPPAEPDRPVMPEATATATATEAIVAEASASGTVEEAIEAVEEPAPSSPAAQTPGTPGSTIAAPEEASIAATDAIADEAGPTTPVDAADMADGTDASTDPDARASPIDAPPEAEPAAPAADAGPEPPPAPAPATDDDAGEASDIATAPSFLPARPTVARAASRRWLPPAAVAALALLLGLQVLLADRARLAADAQWRPLVVSLCNVFGCDVPAWREPAAFTLLAREVRPHPQAAAALRVDATFRNDARWPQAWPRLLLTLSDVEGRPVAARAFDPGEYLAEPATAATLDSGDTARIRLDVREPAAATVSYSFDFR